MKPAYLFALGTVFVSNLFVDLSGLAKLAWDKDPRRHSSKSHASAQAALSWQDGSPN